MNMPDESADAVYSAIANGRVLTNLKSFIPIKSDASLSAFMYRSVS